jgi:hypothetical protein
VRELTASAVPAYIAARTGCAAENVIATSLGGGISNHVTLVETPGKRFVLKQSLSKLRVEEDWYSDRERVFRESGALRNLSTLLPSDSVPTVLFEDHENFAFGMTAAPADAVTWKTLLMDGIGDSRVIAENVARIQGAIIASTWKSAEYELEFGDLTTFHQLRLNPYYEVTASRNPDLAPYFAAAIQRCREQRVCLVHGDWSPKNMMVSGGNVMAIDFEVVHFGDPAFDSAFLLNHLLLKCFHRPEAAASLQHAAEAYWHALLQSAPIAANVLETGTLQQLPLLLLARMDGKSPVEYIQNPAVKQNIRRFARGLLQLPTAGISQVFQHLLEPFC